ncbi:MAG: SpoIIE family protein phosphatase [Rubrivivax sp.]
MNQPPEPARTLLLPEARAGQALSIQRTFALAAFFNGVVLVALILGSVMLLGASSRVHQTYLVRYQSYLLADELRQSSDDLTRFARTYVVTGDAQWKKRYWDTLAIRNGELPRPDRYEAIYWDIEAVEPGFRAGANALPLARRMEQLGFSAEELAKLRQGEANSNGLVNIEMTAMNAVEGLFRDAQGGFTVRAAPDPQLAQRLMHDEAYHQAKAQIMRPIAEFYELLDARTQFMVQQGVQTQERWLNFTLVLILLLGASATATYVYIKRHIVKPLSRLSDEAYAIADQRLDQRLSAHTGNEVGQLAVAFNSVLDRMSAALREADAANQDLRAAYRQIDDSIRYASLLQDTLLPRRQIARAFADDHFVLWQPRDRVGGDFYVFYAQGGLQMLGIGDCAGHGVPGAMMTMLAQAAVDRAVHQAGVESPAAVLARTDEALRAMLAEAHLTRAVATTMDLGLVCLDREAGVLRFSGAKIALYWTDGQEVRAVKGDRRALVDRRPGTYQDHALPLAPGGTYHLTTDGFLDQAGGEHGFGFGDERFADMLREHAAQPLARQGEAFARTLDHYRGDRAQRDDITLLSFKIPPRDT